MRNVIEEANQIITEYISNEHIEKKEKNNKFHIKKRYIIIGLILITIIAFFKYKM